MACLYALMCIHILIEKLECISFHFVQHASNRENSVQLTKGLLVLIIEYSTKFFKKFNF